MKSEILNPDGEAFDSVWSEIVVLEIDNYRRRFSGISVLENAKKLVWDKYCQFNTHIKDTYMRDPAKPLDRHKVCAAYIYAIESAHIIVFSGFDDTDEKYNTLNENLAISVGLSLLASFLVAKLNKSASISEKLREEYLSKVEKGMALPKCNHGNYRSNLVGELHNTYIEGNYNLLGLADKLFLLEIYTLQLYDKIIEWE